MLHAIDTRRRLKTQVWKDVERHPITVHMPPCSLLEQEQKALSEMPVKLAQNTAAQLLFFFLKKKKKDFHRNAVIRLVA